MRVFLDRQDGELLLGDGRRLCRKRDSARDIHDLVVLESAAIQGNRPSDTLIHPDFRLWVGCLSKLGLQALTKGRCTMSRLKLSVCVGRKTRTAAFNSLLYSLLLSSQFDDYFLWRSAACICSTFVSYARIDRRSRFWPIVLASLFMEIIFSANAVTFSRQ